MMEMAHDQRELSSEEEAVAGDLRRGPWTVEEDLLLVNYIAAHGEGRWNALARCAGLKRTGKSCRLRWLNYLRPDLRRGNITAQEQLLILELHSRWGNRWSKIAQHLPGRTDNEIKNYWRTRVQKHAKQLKCDVNSQQFKDLMRYLWMPRLLERIHSSASDGAMLHQSTPLSSLLPAAPVDQVIDLSPAADVELSCTTALSSSSVSTDAGMQFVSPPPLVASAESAPGSNDGSSYSYNTSTMYDTVCQPPPHSGLMTQYQQPESQFGAETCSWSESLPGLTGLYADIGLPDLEICGGAGLGETMWCTGADDLWSTQMLGL